MSRTILFIPQERGAISSSMPILFRQRLVIGWLYPSITMRDIEVTAPMLWWNKTRGRSKVWAIERRQWSNRKKWMCCQHYNAYLRSSKWLCTMNPSRVGGSAPSIQNSKSCHVTKDLWIEHRKKAQDVRWLKLLRHCNTIHVKAYIPTG